MEKLVGFVEFERRKIGKVLVEERVKARNKMQPTNPKANINVETHSRRTLL